MLKLHERLAEARIERERTVVGHRIEATDRQIDRLAYELYCLTDDKDRRGGDRLVINSGCLPAGLFEEAPG